MTTEGGHWLALLETAADAFLGLDERGRVRWASPSAERLFGRGLGGTPIEALLVDPPPTTSAGPLEALGRRRDGSIFPVELTQGRALVDGVPHTALVLRDITERRLLEQQVLAAADELKTRIGRDLHDGLGQLLTGVAFIAQGMEADLEPKQAARASRIVALVNEAIRLTRDLSHGLAPISVAERSFVGALHDLVRSCGDIFGVPCSFECSHDLAPAAAVGTQLYFITREAITNAVRHGQASHIDVTLTSAENRSMLCIRNDGRAFSPEAPGGPGFGLRSMRYRARMIGGTLDIGPRDGGGTVVVCRWGA